MIVSTGGRRRWHFFSNNAKHARLIPGIYLAPAKVLEQCFELFELFDNPRDKFTLHGNNFFALRFLTVGKWNLTWLYVITDENTTSHWYFLCFYCVHEGEWKLKKKNPNKQKKNVSKKNKPFFFLKTTAVVRPLLMQYAVGLQSVGNGAIGTFAWAFGPNMYVRNCCFLPQNDLGLSPRPI